MGFYQDLKDTYRIKALCRTLGLPEKRALVHVAINKHTRGGSLGPEVFRLRSSLPLESILLSFKFLGKDALEDFKRLYTDPVFRDEMYKEYMQLIKDRFQRYELKDVLLAYLRRGPI